MEKIYDESPIFNDSMNVVESYIGYGKNDLSSMDKKELLKELQRTEREINQIQYEIDDSVNNNYPIFTMKERLEDALYYKDKVLDAIDKISTDKSNTDCKENKSKKTVEESTNLCVIDRLINDLNRYYEKGIITEEYKDLYTKKLNDKRQLYEENVRNAEIALKEEQDRLNKSRFRKFKNKLSEYKKK